MVETVLDTAELRCGLMGLELFSIKILYIRSHLCFYLILSFVYGHCYGRKIHLLLGLFNSYSLRHGELLPLLHFLTLPSLRRVNRLTRNALCDALDLKILILHPYGRVDLFRGFLLGLCILKA